MTIIKTEIRARVLAIYSPRLGRGRDINKKEGPKLELNNKIESLLYVKYRGD